MHLSSRPPLKAWHALAAWLALAAVLLATTAPTVSRLLASPLQLAALNAIVCSVDGKGVVKTPVRTPAGHADHDGGLCPFCLPHGGSVAVLAEVPSWALGVLGAHVLPPRFYQTTRPLFHWAAAHPRGPPSLS